MGPEVVSQVWLTHHSFKAWLESNWAGAKAGALYETYYMMCDAIDYELNQIINNLNNC